MLQWMEWSAARAAMGVKEAARPDHRSIGSNLFIPPLLLRHFLLASLLPASINRAIDEETDCGWNIFLCNAKSFVPHHIMHIIIIVQLGWPHTSHSLSSFVTCLRHLLAHCIRASALFYIFLHLSYIWRARHNHWPNREKSDWNNKNNNSSIEMKNGSRFYVPFVHIKCQCPSRFNPNHHHHSIKRSIDR